MIAFVLCRRETHTHTMEDTLTLVQELKKSGELTGIRESYLYSYYTCVRYSNTVVGKSGYSGPMGTELTYYGPGQWSCMKGWFETYDNAFKGRVLDHKVLTYSAFRNTEKALKKDLGTFNLLVQ